MNKSSKSLFAVLSLKGNGTDTSLREEVLNRMYSLSKEPVIERTTTECEVEIPAFLIKIQDQRRMSRYGHI